MTLREIIAKHPRDYIRIDFNPGRGCHKWTILEHGDAMESRLIAEDFGFLIDCVPAFEDECSDADYYDVYVIM